MPGSRIFATIALPNRQPYPVVVPTSTTLSRQQLYDLVWSEPMTKVSASLGISDRGLAKICMRHEVPTPPRGYWARATTGRNGNRIPLPDLGDEHHVPLTVFNTLSALPTGIAEVVREARHGRREQGKGRLRGVKSDVHPTAIPLILCPTIDALLTAIPDNDGHVQSDNGGKCAVRVHQRHVERAVRLLSRLANSLLDEGMDVLANRTAIQAIGGSDKLEFTLAERTQNGDTGTGGQLVVSIISRGGTGLRRVWSDRKAQPIEEQLPKIVAGFQAFLRAEKAKREDNEHRRRQRQHVEHRQLLAQQRKDREEKRIGHLKRIVELRQEANEIGNWLASLPVDQVVADCTELGRMVKWATSRQSRLESLTTLQAASALINGRDLFPEIDDLQDPEGDLLI